MTFLSFPRIVTSGIVLMFGLIATGHSFDLPSLAGKLHSKQGAQKPPFSDRTGTVPELPQSGDDFEKCKSSFFNGKPPVVGPTSDAKLRSLCYDGFATLYSGTHKIPVYSAEVLNKATLGYENHQERTNFFFEDARLRKAERALLSDYEGSGFDRGHAFPAEDGRAPEPMAQSFSLSNMVPQAPKHNRNLWLGYEKATRKYALRAQGNVYVITGSVVNASQCTIANALSGAMPRRYDLQACTIGNGVAVPAFIYKVVFDPAAQRAWAYWTQNTNEQKAGAPISYAEAVRLTGIDFFPGAVIQR